MSDYKRIGDYIEKVDKRNKSEVVKDLKGINIEKYFMPSVANVVGTDLSRYKIVKPGEFACNRMHVGRDYKLPVAFSEYEEDIIVSPAYDVFRITNQNALLPEYLMMWFSRDEFDRNAWFYTDTDVRGKLGWEDFCNMKLPVPPLAKQQKIVQEYQRINKRIQLNEKLIQKLEETAQELFNSCFNQQETNGEFKRLGDLIEIRGGFSYNSKDLSRGNSYLLGMGCISFSSRFLEDGMRLYSDEYPEKYQVKPKDIVIATRQQSENMPILGYPAMIPPDLEEKKLVVASNLYRVLNKSDWSNEVLYQLLRSPDYLEHIRLNTKGTTVGMITKDAIEDYYFNLPKSKFIAKLNIDLQTIVNLIFTKRKEIKHLIMMNGVILSKLTNLITIENEYMAENE